MKAAVWYDNSDIRIEERPDPPPGPGEMLVQVISCGVCGSDVVEWYRLPRAPLVQGHEVGGAVVAVGAGVTRFAPGDRVFVAPKVPCGACKRCRDGHHPQCAEIKERLPGGFAERILVPAPIVARGAYRLPDSVSFDRATFVEPLACAIRAQRLAGLRRGQAVLVLGCGMSGLLQIQLAKRAGCTVAATDVDPGKLARAAALGADAAFPADAGAAERATAALGGKADAVLLCTGAPAAIDQAWAGVDKGGAVVFFAVPGPEVPVAFPANAFWTQEIRVLTSYYCGPPDLEEALRLLAASAIEVDSLVTHRLPLAETARAFRLVLGGKEAIKVIVKPNGLDR